MSAASMLISAMSLTTTATRWPAGAAVRRWRRTVVLPLPRKPDRTVTRGGTGAAGAAVVGDAGDVAIAAAAAGAAPDRDPSGPTGAAAAAMVFQKS